MFFCVNASCVPTQTCARFEAVCFDKNTGKHRSQNSHADSNCSSPLFPRCLVWTREEGSASLPGCRCVLAQAIDFSWALGPCTSEESLSNFSCSFTRQSTAAKMLWREHKSHATTCTWTVQYQHCFFTSRYTSCWHDKAKEFIHPTCY